MRARLGEPDLRLTDLPLPEEWPHHAYISSDACDADRILAVFAREGWKAEVRRPARRGFSLVRGTIENHTSVEFVRADMRAEYERFFAEVVNRPRA